MKRESKFRAWNKKRKKMYKVLHLHMNDYEGVWATVEGFDIIEQKNIHIQIQPKDIEVMQSTEVHDDSEEETEIFKDDILEIIYNQEKINCKVVFEAGGYILVSEKFTDGYISFHKIFEFDGDYYWLPQSKVIGNCYENPKLLEDKP